MRRFLPVFILLALVSCGRGEVGGTPSLPAGGAKPPVNVVATSPQNVLSRGPVIQRVTEDGVTFMGKPSPRLMHEKISVAVTPEGGATRTATADFDAVRDTFLVRIEGLPANTACRYSVTIGKETTGPFQFATAPSSADDQIPLRFVVYGDSRSNPQTHHEITEAIRAKQPRFVLHTGDLVGNGLDGPSWDIEFFNPARALLASTNILPCYGNHENDTAYLANLFDLPEGGHYYTFDFGRVRILTLDVYADFRSGSEQHTWLEKELSRKWNGWTFVQFHEPPFSVHTYRKGNADVRRELIPLFSRYTVDAVFSGHDHYYLRTKPIASEKGARAVVYFTAAGGGAPLHSTQDRPFAAAVYEGFHFVVLDVTNQKITGWVETPDGKVVDKFVFEKSKPAAESMSMEEVLQE
ncbi:MAG: metallophosphoesterase [Planctomycetota bacterium]